MTLKSGNATRTEQAISGIEIYKNLSRTNDAEKVNSKIFVLLYITEVLFLSRYKIHLTHNQFLTQKQGRLLLTSRK